MSSDNERSLLLDKVEVASTFFNRMKGLLHRDGFTTTNGLIITPCNYVHTFGMKFAIDIVFIDKNYRVIGFRTNVKKNKIAGSINSKHTLELPAGKLQSLNIEMGDRICW